MRGREETPWRTRAGIVVVLASAIVFAAATARLFVWPARDRPTRSDAIVLLAGDGPRKSTAVSLAAAGLAPVLVVSTGVPLTYHCVPTVARVEVICFHPHPATTQGEARYVADLAAKRHWHRLIVVMGTPQDTRARLRIKRCFRGTTLVVPVDPGLPTWIKGVAYEWGALVKALAWQRTC